MIKLGYEATELAEKGLETLRKDTKESTRGVYKQEDIGGMFTKNDLISVLENIKGVYSIDWSYIYSNDGSDGEQYVDSIEDVEIIFDMTEPDKTQKTEDILHYIQKWIESDICGEIVSSYNFFTEWNNDISNEEN
jgi:predicted RNA-binding protein with EMAP domain